MVWSNQWEPATKRQHASEVYEARFGPKGHTNLDIAEIPTSEIPDADMLVGGFPCQDYSVATTLRNSKGLIGKKGVLWWSIHRILSEKKNPPKYLFLENVDRLLKSPSTQRGRDFAVILKSLDELGYAVEWRVINAADYGMPQRRRRVFILAYHKGSAIFDQLKSTDPITWTNRSGVLARAFPITQASELEVSDIKGDLVEISEAFNKNGTTSPFLDAGIMINGSMATHKSTPQYDGSFSVLGDILEQGLPHDDFLIPEGSLEKWTYHKGAKRETRTTATGYDYQYTEGAMTFPDDLSRPSRTIITSEGGKTPSRFKHVVPGPKGLRRLTPIELERLNMFPDNHTRLPKISDGKRAFLMGNALVVGVVQKIGISLRNSLTECNTKV